jgi:uncharacterized protein (TIGR02453 family)
MIVPFHFAKAEWLGTARKKERGKRMFQGFTDETVDFMWGIRLNNEKPWFEAHKEEYRQYFYQPMKDLGDELFDWFTKKRKDLPLRGRVSRIYRDARRLHGRGPYKDHLWISVEAPAESVWTSQPTFWFELGPDAWSYGLGYYAATPITMLKLRTRMEKNPEPMRRLLKKLNRQEEFVLSGEVYKRPKEGAKDTLLAPLYNMKNFSFVHEEGLGEILFSRDLAERLKTGYQFLLPFYDYIVTLDSDPDPREEI